MTSRYPTLGRELIELLHAFTTGRRSGAPGRAAAREAVWLWAGYLSVYPGGPMRSKSLLQKECGARP